MASTSSSSSGAFPPAPTTSTAAPRVPDFVGVLYVKQRARRRLSAFIEGKAKKDVLNGSDRTATRRRSLSNQFDGPAVVRKFYFELTGHLLAWYDCDSSTLAPTSTSTALPPRGSISVLSLSGIHRLTKDHVPEPFVGGFCMSDAASDQLPRRGDVLFYSENSLQLANWIGLLETAFRAYHCDPLAELHGPTQAASEKPILQGEMLTRDTLDGLPLDSWTKLHVSLFDNRLEFRSLHAPANSNEPRRRSSMFKQVATSLVVPTVRVDRLTVNFYVGDSRLCSNAFLVSDFQVTHHFAARDHMEKLFWMQTLAKMLRQLVAMHEHALHAKSAIKSGTGGGKQQQEGRGHMDSDDEDDDDDDDEEDEDAKDARRPPQVRRESMYRYYGLKMPPKEEETQQPVAAKPPLPAAAKSAAAAAVPSSSSADKRMQRVQEAVSKSLGTAASTVMKRNKPTAAASTDALTVFYQDAEASWVDVDLDRLSRVAKQASAGGGGGAGGGAVKVSFGQLAKHWGDKDADALEGVLLKAKRKGLAKYEGDMLFRDYDDAVMVEVKV